MAVPVRILFVCLGNICRSPAAEGVLRTVATRAGLADRLHIASAGTASYHVGQPPDARMTAAASRRGHALNSRARHLHAADLDLYDLVLVMDEANRRDVLALASTDTARAKVRPFATFCRHPAATEIPDPYYGGPEGFDHVLDLLEDGCVNLLDHLRHRLR